MAKYERLGYCPNNAFMTFDFGGTSTVARSTQSILGARPVYMVYDEKDHFWDPTARDTIVDALYGGDGVLGIQVATYLELILPEPLEDQDGEGRMIILHDVINPKQIDEGILGFGFEGTIKIPEWMFSTNGGVSRKRKPTAKADKESTKKIYFDDRYLVCIQDFGGRKPVHIFLLRTLPASSKEYMDIGNRTLPDVQSGDNSGDLPSHIQVGS